MSKLDHFASVQDCILRAFNYVAETGYSMLDHFDPDDERDSGEADDIRCQFSNAVGEVMHILCMPDDAEVVGEVMDIILEERTGLKEFFDANPS